MKVKFGMEANLDQGLVMMRAWQPLNTVWCNEEVNKKVMLVSRKEVLSVKSQDSLVRNVSSSHSLAGWEVYLSCDVSFYKGPSVKLAKAPESFDLFVFDLYFLLVWTISSIHSLSLLAFPRRVVTQHSLGKRRRTTWKGHQPMTRTTIYALNDTQG